MTSSTTNQLEEYKKMMEDRRKKQNPLSEEASALTHVQSHDLSPNEKKLVEKERMSREKQLSEETIETSQQKQNENKKKKEMIRKGMMLNEGLKSAILQGEGSTAMNQSNHSENVSPKPGKWTSEEAAKVQNKTMLTPGTIKKMEQEKIFCDVPSNDEPISPTSIKCIIQIRLPNATLLKAQFQSEDYLSAICDYVIQQTDDQHLKDGIALVTSLFPKRVRFDGDKLKTTTLVQANLVPNGTGYKPESQIKQSYKKVDITDVLSYRGETTLRGETFEEKKAFKERMRLKEMERAQREKRIKKQELARLRKQLKADKEARAKGTTESSNITNATTSSAQTSSAPSQKYSEAAIQLRFPSGKAKIFTFNPSDTLHTIHQKLLSTSETKSEIGSSSDYSFIGIPRKEYKKNEWKRVTLESAGLVPRGSLIVQLSSAKGVVKQGESYVTNDDDDDDDDEE